MRFQDIVLPLIGFLTIAEAACTKRAQTISSTSTTSSISTEPTSNNYLPDGSFERPGDLGGFTFQSEQGDNTAALSTGEEGITPQGGSKFLLFKIDDPGYGASFNLRHAPITGNFPSGTYLRLSFWVWYKTGGDYEIYALLGNTNFWMTGGVLGGFPAGGSGWVYLTLVERVTEVNPTLIFEFFAAAGASDFAIDSISIVPADASEWVDPTL